MGTAARQRRIRRMRFLAGLAEENPYGFDKEWEKKLNSWLEQVFERGSE